MLGAFRQFKAYPLQSLLIALAVALGVAVVTAVAATFSQYNRQLGSNELWQRQITLQTKSNNWNAFYSGGETIPVREVGRLDDEKVALTPDDLTAAKEASPTVDYAYLMGWDSYTVAGDDSLEFEVRPVTADYLAAANIQVIQGSLPSASDFAEQRNVLLLAEGALGKLGLEGDPVGQSVKLSSFEGEKSFTVVGVLEGSERGINGPTALVPYKPTPWGEDGLQNLTFAVADKANLAQARAELQAYAEKQWGDRVTVSSPDDLNAGGQVRLMAVVIAAFASTALAAAALNIMNLMLARVLKRRHTIGILRSLGASRAVILRQFLGESLLLGAVGGVLGVLAGYGLYAAFNSYQTAFYGDDFSSFIASVPWTALPVGFGLALLTSLLFGFYPAWQASRLRPVEALREV
ncbi:ABC transporter permease [soil metagenome]